VLLSNAGASRVDGIDISHEAINYARGNFHGDNVRFEVGDIYDYAAPDLYDMVVCLETVEHVEDYARALKSLYSLLRRGGRLFISSPNRLLTSWSNASMRDEPGNPYHFVEFTIDELVNELTHQGFLVDKTDVFGQRQRPFYGRYLSMLHRKLLLPDASVLALL
jgi:SAM-dependent methyltransferase